MRHAPSDDKWDQEELARLNAEPWQIELLRMNPDYNAWGPGEDYMSTTGGGWSKSAIHGTWEAFGPWELDDLNELVNFHFEVNRENVECPDCGRSGYTPVARQLAEDWYDFEKTGREWHDKIGRAEVDALWKAGRLKLDFKEKPTPEEVNTWQRGRCMGHDAINRAICIRARAESMGEPVDCPKCEGHGYVYTTPAAHVSLVLWFLHPRKGCSRGVEIKRIERSELPAVFNYLREAARRNAERFSKID